MGTADRQGGKIGRGELGGKGGVEVLTFGSLFSGAGGLDKGFEDAGFKPAWQVEKNRICQQVLEKHYPGLPRWVVRENVPAPDDVHFEAALDVLGYRCAIIRTDASTFTGQQRVRDFIIGSIKTSWPSHAGQLCQAQRSQRYYSPRCGERQVIPCLTTNRRRYDSRDSYVFDGALRILDGDERTAFAGFPPGWFAGFSEAAIARMCGNAVVPAIGKLIGWIIREVEETHDPHSL